MDTGLLKAFLEVSRSRHFGRAANNLFISQSAISARIKQLEEELGVVADPFGETEANVRSQYSGIVIGRTNLPLVNEGDALYHIARFEDIEEVEAKVDELHEEHLPELSPSPKPESPII